MFNFEPNDCDVNDVERLAKFRRKYSEWVEWLDGDDIHSINRQIYNVMSSDAAFRIVKSARKHAKCFGGEYACMNSYVGHLVDKGFAFEQLLLFRRLVEPPKDDRKQVISLRRLIDELKDERSLFSREVFVGFDGDTFDYESQKKALVDGSVGFQGFDVSGPNSWKMSELKHRAFDKYCEGEPDHTSRDQVLSDKIFDDLETLISTEALVNSKYYVNKVLAHAAAPANRDDSALSGPTIRQIEEGQKSICKIVELIGGTLLWKSGFSGVPTPQFDVFLNLSNPFLPEQALDSINKEWRDGNKQRENWGGSNIVQD